jgi:bifunctional non-homologous end joining protein LigD
MAGRSATPQERLERYRAKRDFSITAEPEGTAAPATDGYRFVVQRHRARRPHYDLRLEAAGVLLSWAVPKGPTLDPDVRRMAVHVEDHPLDYFDFEGVIPAGEYGGGDVVVWDWGTWSPVGDEDPIRAVADGNLHFDLDGEKLHGRFVLVRTRRGSERDWMLIKKHDDAAVTGWDPDAHPRSVKSGRTNDEVKDAPSASWSGRGNWAGATADELAVLDGLGPAGDWTIAGQTVRLHALDTVVLPARARRRAITRRDLVRHAAVAAPVLLPYVADRPLAVHRFPAGLDARGSWRTSLPARAPAWLTRDGDADGSRPLIADTAAALVWIVDDGGVELAPAAAPRDRTPTWAVVELAARSFDDVLVLARLHRTALAHLGLEGGPVLTGTGGVDIWVPVAGSAADGGAEWVGQVRATVARTVPDVEPAPRDRSARVVAPFSPRAAAGGPVAVPITWDELDEPDLLRAGWTVTTVGERIATVGDPLAPLIGRRQRLPTLR